MIGDRRAALPSRLAPQLASLVGAAPPGKEWLHELKLDGYRILARIDRGRVKLLTRNGEDWTGRFALVSRALARLPIEQAWLDGEMVVLDEEDISSFQLLQEAIGRGSDEGIVYFAFDLLYLDGVDMRSAPLTERKTRLRPLIPRRARTLHSLDILEGDGPAVLARACARGFEGIVSKRRDAPYQAGRGRSWLKIKCVMRQEFVVGGFTDSDRGLDFGALLLGAHDAAGRLVYVGRVGTGFSVRARKALRARLAGLERVGAPFSNPPKGADARGVHWVKPALVAEIAFTNRTRDGLLRHPAFQGLREDKRPVQVLEEAPVEPTPRRRRS